MQQFMAMVLGLEFFILCIAGSFWFFGTELGIIAIKDRSLDLEEIEAQYDTTAQGYETSPFNAVFVFGDFGRAITEFMATLVSGDTPELMARFGFAQSFIFIIILLTAFAVICTLIYMISGRG